MAANYKSTSSPSSPLIEDDQRFVHSRIGEPRFIRGFGLWEEAKKQLRLAAPLIAVNVMLSLSQLISSMFVGRLGQLSLSGSSLAASFASLTAFSVLMGMASALDTLCGQSFGAKQYHMLGIHLQRGIFILLLVCLPLSIILANSGPILIALGQNSQIAAEAEKYALCLIPSLFGYSLLQSLIKFLQTQSIVFPMMITTAIASLLHIFSCWILVLKSGLGIRGAALANGIFYWVNVLLLGLYVKHSPSCLKTWTGCSKEALYDIPDFLKLAIPSAFMVCLTNWSFELTVFVAGLLPNPQLETSVLSICFNTAATIWMIPFGLSCAVSTRVSNELGAGNPQAARLAVLVVLILTITEGAFVGFLLVLLRNWWGYAYSNEAQVVRYVAAMLPILAFSNLADGIECVLSGVIRGCGWQKIGAYVNLGSYYLVGMPSAILLAFVLHIGGMGLWLGIVCAIIVQMASLLTITIRTNWENEAERAVDRVRKSAVPVDGVS